VSAAKARQLGITKPVRVVSTVLVSGWDHAPDETAAGEVSSKQVTTTPAWAERHQRHRAARRLGAGRDLRVRVPGSLPQGRRRAAGSRRRHQARRPSAGQHLRRPAAQGHPVGATGAAQIVELTEQLQGRSGARQVQGGGSAWRRTAAATSASTSPRCASRSADLRQWSWSDPVVVVSGQWSAGRPAQPALRMHGTKFAQTAPNHDPDTDH